MFVHFGKWDRQPSFDSSESQALDFARNVHSDMLETNRDLYTRAQLMVFSPALLPGDSSQGPKIFGQQSLSSRL